MQLVDIEHADRRRLCVGGGTSVPAREGPCAPKVPPGGRDVDAARASRYRSQKPCGRGE